MYIYEKVQYEDILADCRKAEIEMIIKNSASKIEKFSNERGICIDDVKKQIRLHAPHFKKRLYTSRDFFNNNMMPLLDKLFDSSYIETYNEYIKKSRAEYFFGDISTSIKIKDGKCWVVPCQKVICDSSRRVKYSCDNSNSKRLPIEIREVGSEEGAMIENRLHYLRSERKDSLVRIGLYLPNCEYPICYMSYCVVDREDKRIALAKSVGDDSILEQQMIELSRAYGCGKLPCNAITFLHSRAIKEPKLMKYKIFITAVNPVLGFTGSSVRGAGFIPYATRHVSYFYDENGLYCTNRKNTTKSEQALTKMPNNILYVQCRDLFSDGTYFKLIDINNHYDSQKASIEYRIHEIRNDLEKAWDEKTRYHGVDISDGEKPIISKGQCGVSSLLLAKIIAQEYHYNALFCEGDAEFPKKGKKKDASITNHCWIEIDNYNNHGKTVLIDITADQNGYEHKVIFDYKEDLRNRGILYAEKIRSQAKDVNVEHLRNRLELLSETIKNKDLL